MKKSIDIINLQLISITEGKKLGTVKSIVIDANAGIVTALAIEDAKWYLGAKFLPLSAVASIGEYAVTTISSDALVSISAMPEMEILLENDIQVIGSKVLTTSGKIQGCVTEISIDESGKIVECEVEDKGELTTITADKIVTFGKEVLVINEEATPNIDPIKQSVPHVAPKNPVVTSSSAPIQEKEEATQPEDTTKKFDEKQRKYLLGKKANRRITTDNGVSIVENGGEITEEVLQKAKLAGKFVELSMSIQ